MPNWCSFTMGIGGKPDDVEKLYDVLCWEYRGAKPEDPHMFRISDINILSDCQECEDWRKLVVGGECAWSVQGCMFNNPHAYYAQWQEEIKRAKDANNKEEIDRLTSKNCTTIDKLSKDLNLTIEIFSTEPGMEFCEYYLLKNGEIIEDEEGWYKSVCIDDYETYDDYIADCTEAPMDVTRHDFEKAVEAGDSFISHAEYRFLDIIPEDKPLKFREPKEESEDTHNNKRQYTKETVESAKVKLEEDIADA